MPRGIPRSGVRRRKVSVQPEVETTSKAVEVKPVVTPKETVKTHYSCGCKVIPINETRNKEKCPVHGVA